MDVGPLELEDVDRMLRARLRIALPRSTIVQIHHAAGGNPLFAVEIARDLQQSGAHLKPGEPLPVPRSLKVLMLKLLGHLPESTRRVLLFISAQAQPSLSVLEQAFGARGKAAMIKAVDAGITSLDGDRIE